MAVSATYPTVGQSSFIHRQRCAFTLVEMLVVVAVVLIILALALPAASALWKERKSAESVNTLQGLLMTARAKAMQPDAVETGFLAFVDKDGVQHLAPIEQRRDTLYCEGWQDVFVLTDKADQLMPAPMRVVPRYAVESPPAGNASGSVNVFDDVELANDDFENPPGDQAQRHRNFFTMIFSTDGRLLVGRDVIIQDPDEVEQVNVDDARRGDRTGLVVSEGPVDDFYARDNETQPLDLQCAHLDDSDERERTDFIVPAAQPSVAINFPSVDGLLVYDESLYGPLTPPEKRAFLLESARPLYVSRWTGTVVLGPVGEPLPTP